MHVFSLVVLLLAVASRQACAFVIESTVAELCGSSSLEVVRAILSSWPISHPSTPLQLLQSSHLDFVHVYSSTVESQDRQVELAGLYANPSLHKILYRMEKLQNNWELSRLTILNPVAPPYQGNIGCRQFQPNLFTFQERFQLLRFMKLNLPHSMTASSWQKNLFLGLTRRQGVYLAVEAWPLFDAENLGTLLDAVQMFDVSDVARLLLQSLPRTVIFSQLAKLALFVPRSYLDDVERHAVVGLMDQLLSQGTSSYPEKGLGRIRDYWQSEDFKLATLVALAEQVWQGLRDEFTAATLGRRQEAAIIAPVLIDFVCCHSTIWTAFSSLRAKLVWIVNNLDASLLITTRHNSLVRRILNGDAFKGQFSETISWLKGRRWLEATWWDPQDVLNRFAGRYSVLLSERDMRLHIPSSAAVPYSTSPQALLTALKRSCPPWAIPLNACFASPIRASQLSPPTYSLRQYVRQFIDNLEPGRLLERRIDNNCLCWSLGLDRDKFLLLAYFLRCMLHMEMRMDMSAFPGPLVPIGLFAKSFHSKLCSAWDHVGNGAETASFMAGALVEAFSITLDSLDWRSIYSQLSLP